ncbi:MAG: hypothetical protein J5611_01990, partial [Alphaproteobacteria bacterium]|nr:hypothetical protein [Alphaproteobacteria bacterium]
MAENITNKDYITITDTKVMVGGKETTEYRGENIANVEFLPNYLKDIQKVVKREYGIAPTEMHVLASKTTGNYAMSGTPSAKHGKNAWVRFMLANGLQTPWVFNSSYSSASGCAGDCAAACGDLVQNAPAFRSGLFGSVADAIKQKSMNNKITDQDCIKITADGVTVDGESATTYRGEKIRWLKDLSGDFKDIQKIVKSEYGAAPIAMRVMSSETIGECAKPGNPSPKPGKNAWAQFVFANGIETPWVFRDSYSSASDCAGGCAGYCGRGVQRYSGFRSGVFGSVADKIKQKSMNNKITDQDCIKITADGVTVDG